MSGFILLEHYADDRSAEPWDRAVQEATQGWSVKVIQVTSDRAKGLLRHAAHLGAHSSPDWFHVQRDLVKATGLALQRAEQQAVATLAAANEAVAQARRKAAESRCQGARPGGPSPPFEPRVPATERQLRVAQAELARTQQRR